MPKFIFIPIQLLADAHRFQQLAQLRLGAHPDHEQLILRQTYRYPKGLLERCICAGGQRNDFVVLTSGVEGAQVGDGFGHGTLVGVKTWILKDCIIYINNRFVFCVVYRLCSSCPATGWAWRSHFAQCCSSWMSQVWLGGSGGGCHVPLNEACVEPWLYAVWKIALAVEFL